MYKMAPKVEDDAVIMNTWFTGKIHLIHPQISVFYLRRLIHYEVLWIEFFPSKKDMLKS